MLDRGQTECNAKTSFEHCWGANEEDDSQFAKFLDTALGSAFEVETQLLIAKNVGYITEELYNKLFNLDSEIEKQIVGLIRTLRSE